jgi:hypothetical protein
MYEFAGFGFSILFRIVAQARNHRQAGIAVCRSPEMAIELLHWRTIDIFRAQAKNPHLVHFLRT